MTDVRDEMDKFIEETFGIKDFVSCEKNGEYIYFWQNKPFVKFLVSLGRIEVQELFEKNGLEILRKK